MNTKKFSEAMSEIDYKYVAEVLNYKRRSKRTFCNWGTIAACLLVVCFGGIAFFQSNKRVIPQQDNPIPNVVDNSAEKPFVQMASILNNNVGGDTTESAEEVVRITLNQYIAIYTKIELKDTSVLDNFLGDEISHSSNWYCVSGHEDKQYLIQKNSNMYSLWEFQCFDSSFYPYKDVLNIVYQIDSADRITEVMVDPPTMDNTDEGMKLQAEIGNRAITDKEEIKKLYDILASMTCYGQGNWNKINNGIEDSAVDVTNEAMDPIRLGRYLTLVTDYGNEVDGLKYTAVSNMFYEYSGIAYSQLTDIQATEMIDILHIEMLEMAEPLEDENDNDDNVSTSIENIIPEKNDLMNSNQTDEGITLEYVSELQTAISDAMIKGELPFVTSSAIMEKPYRLHLIISSNADENIKKIESFDTQGGAIEVEYQSVGNSLDDMIIAE